MSIFSRLFGGSEKEGDAENAEEAQAEPPAQPPPEAPPLEPAQAAAPEKKRAPAQDEAAAKKTAQAPAQKRTQAPWDPAPAQGANVTKKPTPTGTQSPADPAAAAPAKARPPAAPQARSAPTPPSRISSPGNPPPPKPRTTPGTARAAAPARPPATPASAKVKPNSPDDTAKKDRPAPNPFRPDEQTGDFLVSASVDEQFDSLIRGEEAPPLAPAAPPPAAQAAPPAPAAQAAQPAPAAQAAQPPTAAQAAPAQAAAPSAAQAAPPAVAPEPAPPAAAAAPGFNTTESDERAVRELFEQLAQVHLQPVRTLVSEIRFGTAPSDWLPICKSAVESVAGAAAKMELVPLFEKLAALGDALDSASTGATMIEGDRRDVLVAAYKALTELLPEDFALDTGDDRRRREPVIVNALMRAIPGVDRVTVRRVFAAGLRDLNRLSRARPDEIAATSGVPISTAERISARFRRYVEESGTATVGPEKRERTRLASLVSELESQNTAFASASESWTDEAFAEKRRLRRERDRVWSEIQVVLARLGDLSRLSELEPLPVARRLTSLKRLLENGAARPRV